MGTTSEKLTYLNTTKGLIKDSINLTGANILSTDTFRSYATKLKNGLVDIINNGIDTLYDNFPKVTAEGTEIALNNTYEAPIKLNVVKGDTQQDSYSGKNLCSNAFYESTNTARFVIDKSKLQQTFTLSYISDTTANNGVIYLFTDGTNRGTLNFSIKQTANVREYVTIAVENENWNNIQEATNVWITSYVSGAGHTTSNLVKQAQIENGSSMTDYEPYVGGIASPSPDYPQEVKVVNGLQNVSVSDGTNTTNYEVNLGTLELCKINDYQDSIQKSSGKNLLQITTFSNNSKTITSNNITATINDSGTITVTGTASAETNIYLTKNDFSLSGNFYYLCNSPSANARIEFVCDVDGTRLYLNDYGTGNKRNATTSFAFSSLVLKIANGTQVNTTFTPMVALGTTIEEYEPYGKVWYKKANIKKVVLTGASSEVWGTNGETTNYGQFKYTTNDKEYGAINLISNMFITEVASNKNCIAGRDANSNIYVNIAKSIVSYALNDFKTWLSNNNVTVYYQLLTPTYETITDSTLINQLESIKSKENSTNITINGNLPMIINASALKKE